MSAKILLLPILVPLLAGLVSLLIPKKINLLVKLLSLGATVFNLVLIFVLFNKKLSLTLPWFGPGFEFSLRLYHFSSFIILSTAAFGFLITLYALISMRGKDWPGLFFSFLLVTLSFANGVCLADNLLIMFFFWEGLLLVLFGMIVIGNKGAFKTATKAFIINGITDLCMMVGIAITGHLAGTFVMSNINLPLNMLGSIAFLLLMIGTISKAGSMPFHSWIPDAAIDAPLPFMALMPAALEKLLGIYFLARISLDLFKFSPESTMSIIMMSVGAITIILAVMMALIQKDFKKLLSYHAISQVGYMILGIGTALPIGIVGGLFHMINNALYKSCLFLTGGSVEKQAGTTSLEKLGGLGLKMPITFGCFIIAAVSISGMYPFNGFFSKELVYDAALERGMIFYIAAAAGSFFTAASFLKLGHAAFLGKLSAENKEVKEAPLPMLIPMIVIALTCIFFGIFNSFPINKLIQPILSPERLEGGSFSGMPSNIMLVIITFVILIAAVLNHIFAVKIKGSGLKASDHFRHAPVLEGIYNLAEKKFFDPYEIGVKLVNTASRLFWITDRAFDWVQDSFSVKSIYAISDRLKKLHSGNYAVYLAWSLTGLIIILIISFRS